VRQKWQNNPGSWSIANSKYLNYLQQQEYHTLGNFEQRIVEEIYKTFLSMYREQSCLSSRLLLAYTATRSKCTLCYSSHHCLPLSTSGLLQ
jgi:hypothetical protein